MRFKLAICVGLLAMLGLLGVTIAEMQTADNAAPEVANDVTNVEPSAADAPVVADPPSESAEPAPAADAAAPEQRAADVLPPLSTAQAAPRRTAYDTAPRRARGIYIRPDGMTVGRVSSIDRATLRLVPVPKALVSFLRDRKIIAQAVTDERGIFAVAGLTPWSVCSITASAADSVCMFSAVIRPIPQAVVEGDGQQAAADDAEVRAGWVNEFHFVSMTQDADDSGDDQGGDEDEYLDLRLNEFQTMPREDFLAALRAGLFGSDAGGLPPAPMYPGGGYGGAGAGGGGGGGGGGGTTPDLNKCLIGAGIGAGIGAALGSDDDDDRPASPFQP